MDAKEYLSFARDERRTIQLAHYNVNGQCDARGLGLIIDAVNQIAVVLTDCGNADETAVKAGALVKFVKPLEEPNEVKIIGEPAYARDVVFSNREHH